MASRKSCTHMTWSEAKAKSGTGTTKSGNNNNNGSANLKRENHGKLLAAKIVAKAGPSEMEKIQNRQAARLAKRDQQRQEQLEAQRQAEKERMRSEKVAKPHEQALEKLNDLALAYRNSTPSSSSLWNDQNPIEETLEMSMICESKQLQVDEILALQAIYADHPDRLVVADYCKMEELQLLLEQWQGGSADPAVESSIVHHPPLRLVLQRSVEDPNHDDWVAHCLIQVTFPSNYPLQVTPPPIRIEWFLLTQKSLVVADNKPLESLGILDEASLIHALQAQAQELVGMPCLYEVLDTWWSEHLFDYISLSPIMTSTTLLS